MKTKAPTDPNENPHIGSDFDDCLADEGIRAEAETLALKKLVSLQLPCDQDEDQPDLREPSARSCQSVPDGGKPVKNGCSFGAETGIQIRSRPAFSEAGDRCEKEESGHCLKSPDRGSFDAAGFRKCCNATDPKQTATS